MRRFVPVNLKSPIAILLAFAVSQVAGASVALRNGNEFDDFNDLRFPGGIEPKIERVYNSKTSFSGAFGEGWGNEYDVHLEKAADGSLVVHEYGGGAENRFMPANATPQEMNKAVQEITDIAIKAGVAGSAAGLASYKKRLQTDPTFRNAQWQLFVNQKKLKPREIAVGTKFTSDKFSHQQISKTQDGYVRTFIDGGKTEFFSNDGRLVRLQDKNNNYIKFQYGKDGHLQMLVDNVPRKMFFTYNNLGLISKVETENRRAATYTYNNLRELIASTDVEGNSYTYKYDSSGRHNLIQIGYSDKTTKDISYYGRDKNEHVKSVKDRDGTLTEYAYKEKGNTLEVSTTVKSADGKVVANTKYDYEFAHYPDGGEWTKRLRVNSDGEITDTTYNEKFGLPIRIQQGKDVTTLEYDQVGHVIKKDTPAELTVLRYDLRPGVGKVERVEKTIKGPGGSSTWSEFKYDTRGNLIFAKNSLGKAAKLAYDDKGRILSMLDEKRHTINFKYNENSKPIEIMDPQLGKISVTYANSGEVSKVSSSNKKIAAEVQAEFDDLLAIIRPAGVTLTSK